VPGHRDGDTGRVRVDGQVPKAQAPQEQRRQLLRLAFRGLSNEGVGKFSFDQLLLQ